MSAVGDVEIIPVIEFCVSERHEIWLGVIYAYKGIFMVSRPSKFIIYPFLSDLIYL